MLIPVIQNGTDLFVDSASIAIPWASIFGRPAQINALAALPNGAGVLVNDGAGNLSWASIGGGSVTSVGLAAPASFTVTGSPVTGAGTLTFAYAPGFVPYTSTESSKLATIAAGATVGATWGVNLFSRPTILVNFGALANAAGLLANDGMGNLSWYPTGSLGTVQLINTGGGTTGGPITVSGTVSVDENYAFSWTGQHRWDLPLWAPDGTVALPAYTFRLDPDTGLYRIGADNLGISTNGVARWDINTTRVQQNIELHVLDPDPTHVISGSLVGIRSYTTTSTSTALPVGLGINISTIWGPTSSTDGVGGSIAFNESNQLYGFNIRWTGEANAEGNLDWYRHANNLVGTLFMRMRRDTDQIGFGAGLVSAPALSFHTDTNTGMYLAAADQLAFAAGGANLITATTSTITATVPVLIPVGSAPLPGLAFAADPNCGFYRIGSNSIGFASSGILRWTWGNGSSPTVSTLVIQGPNGAANAPTYGFSVDADNGIYYITTNSWGVSTAGTLRFQYGAAGQLGIGGATYGTAGQAFLSGGAAAPPTWGNPTLVAANFANPTNPGVNLVGANGTAITAMRSDAVLILDQAIAPAWTGAHRWTTSLYSPGGISAAYLGVTSGIPVLGLWNHGNDANEKGWTLNGQGGASGQLGIYSLNDALSDARAAWVGSRSGVAISAIDYGNSTDNPGHTFYGLITSAAGATLGGTTNGTTSITAAGMQFSVGQLIAANVRELFAFGAGIAFYAGTSGASDFALMANSAAAILLPGAGGVSILQQVLLSGQSLNGAAGAVSTYWEVTVNGTPYKIPLHTP